MNQQFRIPEGFSCIREEDLPQMAAWADAEANPTYPVPVIYDRAPLHPRHPPGHAARETGGADTMTNPDRRKSASGMTTGSA